MGKNSRYENGLVCGVGVSDKGKYKAYINGKNTREYDMWQKMIARCYYDKIQQTQPTYIGCEVEDYLLSFQNFCEFYHKNKWGKDIKLSPDKDILCHELDKKIYSRNTILFVDNNINILFTRRQNHHGKYPIGISKYHNKYKVMCNHNGSPIYLGLYDTIEESFSIYKKYKEKIIKQMADEYKLKYLDFPEYIYKAMYNYNVLITD